jgi:hypothetical protein
MSVRKEIVGIYLNRFAHKPSTVNAEWNVDRAALKDVEIRWPRHYQWEAAGDWVDVLKYGFARYVNVSVADDIAQPYKGTVVFEMVIGGQARTVAIGYSDYLPIDEDCAGACDLYFKMQFDKDGYSAGNVVPGGYVPDGKRLYYHLSKLRRLRDERNYITDVSGRFGLAFARETREKAMGLLAGQTDFSFTGGMNPVSYLHFLKEVAQSRICIDLPGLGPFCFRLVNYLAIGACVIAYPHSATLNSPLVDRKHIVYCKPDLSDLVDLCKYYLKNDAEREQIAANAREFFDLNLHKDNLTRYYLHTCLSRLA